MKKTSPKNLLVDCRPSVGQQLADRQPTGLPQNPNYQSTDRDRKTNYIKPLHVSMSRSSVSTRVRSQRKQRALELHAVLQSFFLYSKYFGSLNFYFQTTSFFVPNHNRTILFLSNVSLKLRIFEVNERTFIRPCVLVLLVIDENWAVRAWHMLEIRNLKLTWTINQNLYSILSLSPFV